MNMIWNVAPPSPSTANDPWEILECLPETLVMLDSDRTIVRSNGVLERVFGYRVEDIVGTCFDGLLDGAKSDLASFAAFASRAAAGAAENGDWYGKRQDGTSFPIEVSVSPYVPSEGGGTIAVIRDVSERTRLSEHLRLAQRMEAVGRLAGGVAHDFNNLLTVIRSYTTLLADELRDRPQELGDLHEIEAAAKRAAALTHQLLAFSRQQILQIQNVDLNARVQETGTLLRRLISADTEFLTLLDPSAGFVQADPHQLDQVLMNLVVNARDAMPNGGKLTIYTRKVEFTAEEVRKYPYPVDPGQYALLSVTDTGSGIDPEVVEHIFDPFFTTKDAGHGTGLGLATVYGIVKQSGGNIWLDTEPGRGSTFRVYLRRVEGASVAPSTLAPLTPRRPAGHTVLVVEDEDSVRRIVGVMLEREGYRVLTATNGEEGLRIVQQHPGCIHLILTDLVMPRMGGRELIERVTELGIRSSVLYMSGYTDATDIRQEKSILDAAFISKPFDRGDLLLKVSEVLGETKVMGRASRPSSRGSTLPRI